MVAGGTVQLVLLLERETVRLARAQPLRKPQFPLADYRTGTCFLQSHPTTLAQHDDFLREPAKDVVPRNQSRAIPLTIPQITTLR